MYKGCKGLKEKIKWYVEKEKKGLGVESS